MTINQIVESGMNFGPYPKGHCFFIEKSPTYKKIQNNVQIAEFLLLHYAKDGSPVVWVVEAKSSTPRPATQPNFDEFIALRTHHSELSTCSPVLESLYYYNPYPKCQYRSRLNRGDK